MASKEKNRQMALLTVFAMILVVIGHSEINEYQKEFWIRKWAYSFHMPLFFFISGFLFCLTNPVDKLNRISYFEFIKSKAIRLLVPFLFINTIIFLVKTIIVKDPGELLTPVTLSWHSFINVTLFHPVGFMWFLPTLFTIFILVFPFWKCVKLSYGMNHNMLKITGLILMAIITATVIGQFLPMIFFMQISNALDYIPYFLTGVLYCECKPLIDKIIYKFRGVVIPLFLFISVTLLTTGVVASLCGIIFSVSLALLLEKKVTPFIVSLSSFCYTIFLLSYFHHVFVRGPLARILPDVSPLILYALSFILGFFIPIGIGILFKKIKPSCKPISKLGLLIGL